MTILSPGISVIDPKGEKFRSTVLFAKPVPNEYFQKNQDHKLKPRKGGGGSKDSSGRDINKKLRNFFYLKYTAARLGGTI